MTSTFDLKAADRILEHYFCRSGLALQSNWNVVVNSMLMGGSKSAEAIQHEPAYGHEELKAIGNHRQIRRALQELPATLLFVLTVYYDESRATAAIVGAEKAGTGKGKGARFGDLLSIAALTPTAKQIQQANPQRNIMDIVRVARLNSSLRSNLDRESLSLYNQALGAFADAYHKEHQ